MLNKDLASLFYMLIIVTVVDDCLFVCLMVFNTTFNNISVISWRCRRGRDRMVVEFTTTYAISAYH
jgi:hypothetical protein